jgi:molybdate-binding protein/DNA-binding transcriptional regulator YhcF (GntR family)
MTSDGAAPLGSFGYQEIGDLVRARVARGELRPGDRLTPVRGLAAQLGVNVNTVARAYAVLVREGVLVTRAGGGTRVAPTADAGLFQRAREARLQELIGSVALQALGLGYRPEQIEAALLGQLTRWSGAESAQPVEPARQEAALLFAGSHDPTLDLLAARLRRREPPVWLNTTFSGSLEGLMALAHDQAHLAGCHLLDEQTGEYNVPFVARLLPGRPVLLVTLAQREQGFIVRPGNPAGIRELVDLVQPGVAFAARQRGSGTQVLLECGLRRAGLDPTALQTDGRIYHTHSAVAAAVADGGATVGLGIRAAARAFGLDFVPLATERYELAIPEQLSDQPGPRAVLATLDEAGFQRTLRELGGYDTAETGQQRRVGGTTDIKP